MKNKQNLALFGLMLVAVVVGIFVYVNTKKAPHPLLGKSLLQRSLIQEIDEILISKPMAASEDNPTEQAGQKDQKKDKPSANSPNSQDSGDQVQEESRLVLKLFSNNQWVMASEGNFPASGIKLARTFDSLVNARIMRLVSNNSEDHFRLGIEHGSSMLFRAKGVDKLRLTFGNAYGGGGQYVMVDAGPEVFLVNRNHKLGAQATDWEEKELVHINSNELLSIDYQPAAILHKSPLRLESNKGLFSVIAPEGVKKANQDALRDAGQLLKHLTSVSHLPVEDEAVRQAFADPSRVNVKLVNQMEYHIEVGSQSLYAGERSYYIKIQELKNGQPTDSLLNLIMQRWVFEIPAWGAARFEKGLEDFK